MPLPIYNTYFTTTTTITKKRKENYALPVWQFFLVGNLIDVNRLYRFVIKSLSVKSVSIY